VNQQCKLQWKQWLKETKCPTSIRAAAAKFDILYPTLRKHIIKGTATKLLGCLRRTFPMQPIRTKFNICGHVKGWQRSSNFGRNWPILDKMGVAQVTGSAFFFCLVNQTIYRQLRIGRFPSNFVTKRISTLGVILLQNLKSKIGQTGT